MTSFDLLDLIGQVDERHLEPSFPQKRRVRWKRWGALAACLVFVVGAATVRWNPEPQLQGRPGTDVSSIPGMSAQEPVDVKDLLYGLREGEYSNQVLIINQLSLGDNTAEYHKLEVRSQVDLEDCPAELVIAHLVVIVVDDEVVTYGVVGAGEGDGIIVEKPFRSTL